MLRYVLLAMMTDGKPVHGYALMKTFAARTGIKLSVGNIYRELQRLRAEGMAVSVANPAGADPRRCPCVIAGAGRAALEQWLASSAASVDRGGSDPLLYRVAALSNANAAQGAAFIEEIHALLLSQSRSVARQLARKPAGAKQGDPQATMLPLLLERRARRLEVDLQLLDKLRSMLAGGATRRPPAAANGSRVRARARSHA